MDDIIYLKIPKDYIQTYNKLLIYLADFGEDALKNCDSACSRTNKNIIKCWNMFQSALAAKELGKDKLADVIIKYINAQLDIIYKGIVIDDYVFTGGTQLIVSSEETTLTVDNIVSTKNGNIQNFFVKENTEHLHDITINKEEGSIVFTIDANYDDNNRNEYIILEQDESGKQIVIDIQQSKATVLKVYIDEEMTQEASSVFIDNNTSSIKLYIKSNINWSIN